MRKTLTALALLSAAPVLADPAPSPPEIVAAAPKADWVAIAPSDLLVMDLAADAKGRQRRVVIQMMPPPFSQGWIDNIRKLAAAHWWDGLSINRVQDNYVVQWGDADGENPKKAKALPAGMEKVTEQSYAAALDDLEIGETSPLKEFRLTWANGRNRLVARGPIDLPDTYAPVTLFTGGWPIGLERHHEAGPGHALVWPVHCYGMVGVGRDMPPNTGSGAELYTVIGHAPRHLDRNIALVGRVIEGIEHLSSLPRGHGPLGFYDLAQGDERVAILSVRIGSEVQGLPVYEYLSTESASFAAYAEARANRRDPFFIRPAGGADICNIAVPVRRVK